MKVTKVTGKHLAEFFGKTEATISSYKNAKDVETKRMYYAMRNYFKKFHGLDDAV